MEDQRVLLAKCCRMFEQSGLVNFGGHVSSRISEEIFLINAYGKSRMEVAPEDLVETYLDGSPVDEGVKIPSEVHIHAAIYRARKDVNAVAHLHSPATVSLSIARKPFFPAIYQGTLFAGGIPIHEDARLVNTPSRGERLAKTLAEARIVIMRGHGSAVVADSIKRLFFLSVYFENNARRLLEAYNAGNPEPLSKEEIEDGEKNLVRESVMNKLWDYFESKLDH